jgi:streptogrisin C
MGWQEPAIALAGELERALGDRYGDLWFDPRNGLVKGLTVWRLPDKNAVELDLPRGQRPTTAQQATVAAARRRLGSKLTFGTWAGRMHDLACAWSGGEFDCDPPLRGGVMLYIRSGTSYIPQCTVGFNAKSTVDGKWYVMTAGHCGPPGRTFYVYQRRTLQWHVLGHMHNCVWGEPTSGCVYSGDDDEGIITVDNVPGWNPKPWVYVHAWTGANDRTTENPGYPIYGTGGSRQGMRVCVSGAISGTSCGHVERLGGGSLAQVNLCTTHGDSGAPILSGQKAYGLLKGTNNPDDPCEDRLYQGITEATQRLHVAVALALP